MGLILELFLGSLEPFWGLGGSSQATLITKQNMLKLNLSLSPFGHLASEKQTNSTEKKIDLSSNSGRLYHMHPEPKNFNGLKVSMC